MDTTKPKKTRRKTNAIHCKVLKRINLRNGRMRGKPEGQAVNISSGPPQDVSVAIGKAVGESFKGYNSLGIAGIKIVLLEHLAHIAELEYALALEAKANAKMKA